MSKVKNAELEEAAVHVCGKLLTEIETLIDNMDFSNVQDVKKLKKLIDSYNTLKPYF